MEVVTAKSDATQSQGVLQNLRACISNRWVHFNWRGCNFKLEKMNFSLCISIGKGAFQVQGVHFNWKGAFQLEGCKFQLSVCMFQLEVVNFNWRGTRRGWYRGIMYVISSNMNNLISLENKVG